MPATTTQTKKTKKSNGTNSANLAVMKAVEIGTGSSIIIPKQIAEFLGYVPGARVRATFVKPNAKLEANVVLISGKSYGIHLPAAWMTENRVKQGDSLKADLRTWKVL